MTTTIIVDTRERCPWTFEDENIKGVKLERAKLETGDYSIKGFESRVSIERKSLDDFVGTCMQSRARFYRELERLRSFDLRFVIIESSVSEIFSGRARERVSPQSVMGFIGEINAAQCVPVILAGSRAEAQVYSASILKAAAKRFSAGLEDPQLGG